MYNVVAAFIGALITLMIACNGSLAEGIGNYTSTVIIHLVGLSVLLIILGCTRSKIRFRNHVPLYLYSAGVMGVLTVLFNNISFIALGASVSLAIGLLGQAISSFVIDHYGLLGMSKVKFKKEKILGLVIICIGIGMMMR